jgi:hypothetical protein
VEQFKEKYKKWKRYYEKLIAHYKKEANENK